MEEHRRERSVLVPVIPIASLSDVATADPWLPWDRRVWLVAVPVALFVIYAFVPSVDNGFVVWDDDKNFLENPYFRGLGLAELNWAWTTFWLGVYQPLAWMLFEAQYVRWGLDPHGYHLTSLAFQVVNALVLYFLTVTLLIHGRSDCRLENPWLFLFSAGLATALFAAHPLRVEAVAWASCQPYLPCILFSMLALLAYLRAFPMDSPPRRAWLRGSFILFVTALLFKAPAVSLPAVLLILDVYPLRRFPDATGRWFAAPARRALLEKVPFVVMSVCFMGLAMSARTQSSFMVAHYDTLDGVAQACFGIWFYIGKTVLPLDIITFYALPKEIHWLAPPFVLSIVATAATSLALFVLRRRWPGLLAAWLSFLVMLAPNSGIIRNNSHVIAADRYSYMSMLGSVMLVAAGFCRLSRTSSRWHPQAPVGIITIGVGLLLSLTSLTRAQCRTWFDSEALWAHAVRHGADFSFLAHGNLGVALQSKGRYQEAECQYTTALRLNSSYDKAHNNLGSLLYMQGKFEQAEAHFAEAIRSNPDYDQAHNNLGQMLSRRGKFEEAVAHLTEAIRLNPAYHAAYNNLGNVLYAQGDYDRAAACFAEALRFNPKNADACMNLGLVFLSRGEYEEATTYLLEALRLNPEYAEVHESLGMILCLQRKYAEAKSHFDEAVRLQPGDPKAYNASAMMMASCPEAKYRDGKEAVRLATRACELTEWKNATILDTLAAARAESGDFESAVKSQTKAIELLQGEEHKADYRSRLELYRSKKPYRQVIPQPAANKAGS